MILASSLLVLVLGGCRQPDETTEFTVTVRARDAMLAEAPLAGATVALDSSDGSRQEAETDPDGLATFDVSWEEGPFTVTVDSGLEGQPLSTRLGVTANDVDVPWLFDDVAAPQTVMLSGTAVGHDTSLILGTIAQAFGGGNEISGGGATHYQVAVPQGEPFELFVYEYTYSWSEDVGLWLQPTTLWQRIDPPALDADTTLDITLAATETPLEADFSLALPESLQSDFFAHPYPYARVFSARSRYTNPQGWPTRMQRSAEGDSFDVTVQWLDEADWPLMTRLYRSRSPDRDSVSQRRGTPADIVGDELLPLPVLQDPFSVSLDEPIAFAEVPSDAHPRIDLMADDPVVDEDAAVLWTVIGPLGAGEIDLPDPPSSWSDVLDGAQVVRPGLYRYGTAPDWLDDDRSWDLVAPLPGSRR